MQVLKDEENDKRRNERNEEIDQELIESEKKYQSINQNLKEVQLKLSNLKENKARFEATIEGIGKTLSSSVNSDLEDDSNSDYGYDDQDSREDDYGEQNDYI